MIYLVTQTICRQRVIRVAAKSEAEARQKAKDGYGEIVSRQSKGELLTSSAERVG